MAKHRTRQQKAKTNEQRSRVMAPPVATAQELQVQRTQSFVTIADERSFESDRRKSAQPTSQSLLRVDQAYLKADLRRSLFVSLFLFAVLIGIFWLVRYNGLTMLQSVFYSVTRMTGR